MQTVADCLSAFVFNGAAEIERWCDIVLLLSLWLCLWAVWGLCASVFIDGEGSGDAEPSSRAHTARAHAFLAARLLLVVTQPRPPPSHLSRMCTPALTALSQSPAPRHQCQARRRWSCALHGCWGPTSLTSPRCTPGSW
jgi:hypothetical protein